MKRSTDWKRRPRREGTKRLKRRLKKRLWLRKGGTRKSSARKSNSSKMKGESKEKRSRDTDWSRKLKESNSRSS